MGLEELLSNVRTAKESKRNVTLNLAAFAAAKFMVFGELERDFVRGALIDAAVNRADGLGQVEAEKTTESGLSAGEQAFAFLDKWPTNDIGNMKRFVARNGEDVRFSSALGWFLYDGKRWDKTTDEKILGLAINTAEHLLGCANKHRAMGAGYDRGFVKFANASQSRGKLTAMVELAKAHADIAPPKVFDCDPMLLNLNNGTLNLLTGKLHPHTRVDYVSKLIPIDYNTKAVCPRWKKFLDEVMGGDRKLVRYLQLVVGYCLTGSVAEQCLFVAHGTGDNGKSTFVNVVHRLCAEYAGKAAKQLLVRKGNTGADDEDKAVVDLFGKRFVSIMESDEGLRLNEATLKELTGGDPIRARYLYRQSFIFDPQHKFFMSTNHRPLLKGGDFATARRIRLIPFEVKISPEKKDKDLINKLYTELPGILRWAVQGCLAWQKQGLVTPEIVETATREYLEDHDGIGQLLDDYFIRDPAAKFSRPMFYVRYQEWQKNCGEGVMSARRLYENLRSRGIIDRKIKGDWYFMGIREVSAEDIMPDRESRSRGSKGP